MKFTLSLIYYYKHNEIKFIYTRNYYLYTFIYLFVGLINLHLNIKSKYYFLCYKPFEHRL